MATRSALINVMARAADKAARSLKRDFGEVEHLQVTTKGPGDYVTAADLRAEKTLRQELGKARPGFGFLMEESGVEEGTDRAHRWIVDPLDGTTNFLHGVPHFAISIGLQRDGDMIAGIVFDPIKDELFWAEKGLGAYLNHRRLRVSSRRRLDEALLATGITARRGAESADRADFTAQVSAALAATAGVRRFGAAALDLAYVAAARYDGFWESGLSPWDVAAGMVIVREAGGYISDIDGSDRPLQTGNVLASNAQLHDAISRLLRDATKAAARPA